MNINMDEILICTLDGYQYFLGPEYDGELDWDDAKKWCESLGEGYELPSRLVMLAICVNEDTAALLTECSYYWTSSEVEEFPTHAWLQLWSSGEPGLQGYASKSHLYKVRSVRRRRSVKDKEIAELTKKFETLKRAYDRERRRPIQILGSNAGGNNGE